ncbi:hypothetical protein DsansV1_C03g0036101 [Dioscorea sansibarensis]
MYMYVPISHHLACIHKSQQHSIFNFQAPLCRDMGSVGKASWMVAMSVGAVEALKDQVGLCRWNYALRSLHQHAKNNLGSLSQARRVSSSVDVMRKAEVDEKMKKTEETLKKVMYLTCWGPN